MYPVSLGYSVAKQRINALLKNGNDAEALATTAFTVEKTFRRTLRQIIVSAGFKSTVADKLVNGHRGLSKLKDAWELYDPKHRRLNTVITLADWNAFQTTATMRNKLVHGERVYALAECRKQAQNTLVALDKAKAALDAECAEPLPLFSHRRSVRMAMQVTLSALGSAFRSKDQSLRPSFLDRWVHLVSAKSIAHIDLGTFAQPVAYEMQLIENLWCFASFCEARGEELYAAV